MCLLCAETCSKTQKSTGAYPTLWLLAEQVAHCFVLGGYGSKRMCGLSCTS